MPSTTSYKRGDIVLVFFPFTNLSATEQRPAPVISPDDHNRIGQDLILAAITSHDPHAVDANALTLHPADFREGTLPKQSFVRPSKLFTMHSSIVRRKICALQPAAVVRLLTAIRLIFSCFAGRKGRSHIEARR